MLQVLHDPPSPRASFRLIFKWCRRQALASAEKLFYRVIVMVRGLTTHASHLLAARKLLSPACGNPQPTPTTAVGNDLRRFIVVIWCVHLNLIPQEKIVFIPEPDSIHVGGCPCSWIRRRSSIQTCLHYATACSLTFLRLKIGTCRQAPLPPPVQGRILMVMGRLVCLDIRGCVHGRVVLAFLRHRVMVMSKLPRMAMRLINLSSCRKMV
jgi:hypothetical protein